MDSSNDIDFTGEAATVDELHRVALTIALAVANPREWGCYFF